MPRKWKVHKGAPGRIQKGRPKQVRGWTAKSGGHRGIVSEGSSQEGPFSEEHADRKDCGGLERIGKDVLSAAVERPALWRV